MLSTIVSSDFSVVCGTFVRSFVAKLLPYENFAHGVFANILRKPLINTGMKLIMNCVCDFICGKSGNIAKNSVYILFARLKNANIGIF